METTRWQDSILGQFGREQHQSVVVVDPDRLMQDDVLISELQARQYDILNFTSEIAFRNEFEERYRSRWDRGRRRTLSSSSTQARPAAICPTIWRGRVTSPRSACTRSFRASTASFSQTWTAATTRPCSRPTPRWNLEVHADRSFRGGAAELPIDSDPLMLV